jgi:hypothetical protein
MGNEERELGWEDTIQKDSSFVELPEGDYDFTIDHYERSRFNGSDKIPPCNMAVVYFNIQAPNGDTATVREQFILHTRLEWKLSELFCSVGLKKKGEELRMNWNALPGASGRAHVTLDPDRNDPSKKFNHIDKLYPKEPKKFEAGKF